MKETSKKEMKIVTIGAPTFSNLSKDDLNSFISCLEFQIKDFYKDKYRNLNHNNKIDNSRQN